MKQSFLLLLISALASAFCGYGQSNSPYWNDVKKILQIRQVITTVVGNAPFKLKVMWPGGKEISVEEALNFRCDTFPHTGKFNDTTFIIQKHSFVKTGQLGLDSADRENVRRFDNLLSFIVENIHTNKQYKTSGTYALPVFKIRGYHRRWQNERSIIYHDLLKILTIAGDPFSGQGANGLRFVAETGPITNLDNILSALEHTPSSDGIASTPPAPSSSNILAGSMAFDQFKIIQGIVDWIIKSAKQELLESILEGWYKKLYADPIAGEMLENTLKTYKQFMLDNSLNLAKYGPLWKASFEQDLRNIPAHLEKETFVQKVIDRIAPGWSGTEDLVSTVAGSTTLIYGLFQKKHIVNMLSELAGEYVTMASSWQDQLPIFKRSVILANIVASVIGYMDGNIYKTISSSELKAINDTGWAAFTRKIYLENRNELTLVMGQDPLVILNEIRKGPGAKFYNLLATALGAYQAIQETISLRVPDNDLSFAPIVNINDVDLAKVMDLSMTVVKKVTPYILDSAGLANAPVYRFINQDLDAICTNICQIGQGISSRQYGMVLDGSSSCNT
jgi:hypothetical protein